MFYFRPEYKSRKLSGRIKHCPILMVFIRLEGKATPGDTMALFVGRFLRERSGTAS
ncbi:MAG: hypothetical protein LBH12_07305 [Dysgonamonadaceae bacterium]|jgi:hypothetical protein|nr:hypothetical protein [Dysgonamonadaceae bacterium]